VAVVAVIVWLMVWCCLRRRRTKRANEEEAAAERKQAEIEKARNEEEIRKEAIRPMADSNPKYEIDGKGGRGEMDPGIVNELEGSGLPELGGSRR
jgi:flagellar biosynthesis/type III secretory pathway M-ring protein FliF/YscJ